MDPKLSARIAAVLLGLCLGQAIELVVLWQRRGRAPASEPDEATREAAVDALIARSSGTWDTFVDADVGRVALANLEGREFLGHGVWSNRLGMRERQYAVPKPPRIVRVVLLGDPYVFGYGVEQTDRLGVHLGHYLEAGGDVPAERVEVLHVAQVYYGYRDNGHMRAYSSAILARRGGRELVIEGAHARVLVEEFEVGSFPLGAEATFPLRFALPPETPERDFLTVRTECDDFVYEQVRTGEGAAFALEEIRVE